MIRILKLNEIKKEEIFIRNNEAANVEKTVTEIIENVRNRKDEALYEYCEKFDKVRLDELAVNQKEIADALEQCDPEFLEVIKEAADNIRCFHEKQVRNSFIINEKEGVITGQKIVPIEKVGIYVPGGTAAYPSSVLMNALPAKIAGCKEVVMVTPPSKDGSVDPGILAAAYVAGIDRIFKVGGAQAIAALAYGTQSIPKVDKIVGPGNAYVAEAKKQVYGMVSIDMIAGPSEILVIADGKSDE
ncbi:MAG: histidinol dehydrogenase, partial [Erysipelotrichaceae bacterium]|nr:histidinol dehydrogenase [Erysipelotrichaceae bacterium]